MCETQTIVSRSRQSHRPLAALCRCICPTVPSPASSKSAPCVAECSRIACHGVGRGPSGDRPSSPCRCSQCRLRAGTHGERGEPQCSHACSERAASVHMRGQRRAPRARDTLTAVHTRSREMPREPSRHRWRRGQGPQRRSRPGRPWQTMADHVRAATHNARQCAPMQRSSSGDTYRADLPL